MYKYLLLTLGIMLMACTQSVVAKNNSKSLFVDSIGVYMNSMTMECGKKHYVDVRVKNFRNVTNFQFSINFMKSQMRGDSVVHLNSNFPEFSVTTSTMINGDISFSWADVAAVSLPDDALLFTIVLTPYYYGMSGNGNTPLAFSNTPTPTQAYTSASTSVTYPVSTRSANIKIMDRTPPVTMCPNSQFHKGLDSILVASITGSATDDCGSAMITSHSMTGANNKIGPNDANGKYYKLGVTNVLYTSTDLAGNIGQCPFKIVLVKSADDTLTIVADSRLSRCEDGSMITMGFYINNATNKNITSMNFSLNWDKSAFLYQGFTNVLSSISTANFNTTMTADGKIGFTWSGSALNLPNNQRLFTLQFRSMGNSGVFPITFANAPVAKSFNSSTLGTVYMRGIPGDLIIKDYTVPTIACNRDTLIYEPTGTASQLPILGSVLKPRVMDNCAPQKINYTQTGSTSAVNALLQDAVSVPFNIGTTNVSYKVTDYGANTATCSHVVTVNRLRYTLSSDSMPCATTKSNITFKVSDFEYIRKAKFELKWNPAQVALKQSDIVFADMLFKNNTVITGNAASGSLIFDFTYPTGATILADNATIMTFPFTLTGKVNTALTLTNIESKMIGNNEPITAVITNGQIKNYDTQAPVFANCPADVNQMLSSSATCVKTATWNAPTVTDNCDATVSTSVKITKQQGNRFPANTPTFSGDEFSVGTTIVSYTATDVFGNSSICSFKVIVGKSTKPQITCPSNLTLNTTSAACNVQHTLAPPIALDPCDQNLSVTNDAGSDIFPIGSKIVTFKVEDSFANSATCSSTITVVDKFAPQIVCPANVEKPADLDKDGTNVTWATPVVAEACSTPTSVVATIQSNTYFKIGKTNITYTATDQKANSATCSFSVTVTDTQKPKINCPPTNEIIVNADPAKCGQTVALPTYSDNSGKTPVITASGNIDANNFYPIGKTVVSFTVRDSSGNTASCSFTVNVKDVTKPTFTNAPDLTVNTDPNSCMGTLPPTASPNATDGCNNTNITITRVPVSNEFPIGTTMITFTATDQDGNTATAKMYLTVLDKNPPKITNCPQDITAAAETGKNGASVNWTPPTAQGFCGTNATLSTTNAPGSFFNVGNTIVTYTATDQKGNTSTCTFNVKVIDTQAPTINCPPNNLVEVNADPAKCGQIVPLPNFTDNSGVPATIVTSMNVSPTNFYPIGKTQVSFTVKDNDGNTAYCAFTISVKDVTKPTIGNVKDLTVNTTTSVCTGKIKPADLPTATDGCGNLNITVKSTPSANGDFPLGETIITFTATDDEGNSNTATMKVTVKDIEPPTLENCPSSINISTEPGKDGAIVNWTPPTPKDNCSVTMTGDHSPNTFYKVGTTIVTYTAKDAANNTVTCTFNIIVKDDEAPKIDCKDISIGNDAGKCGATVTVPTVTDNIKVENVVFNPALPANNYFDVNAPKSYTMTATDAAGKTANCTFTVKVSDTEAPKVATCPDNVTISAKAGECMATLNPLPKPTFTDNCDASKLKITNNRDALLMPFEFRAGEDNIVTFTATDDAGKMAICSYKVLVISTEKPTLICPNNINVSLAQAKCDTMLTWQAPLVTVGCAPIVGTPTADLPSGSIFKAGMSTVNYSVKDTKGNEGKCSFTVNVKETTPPKFDDAAFPKDISLAANENDCSAVPTWTLPTATDLCSSVADLTVTKIAGPNIGDKLNIADYVVTYRAVDRAGNSTEKSFTISVKDKTAPKILCPKNDAMKVNLAGAKILDLDNQIISASPSASCKEVSINFKPLIVTENCSPFTVSPSYTAKFPLGAVTPYKFVATDKEGNKTECDVTVEVIDIDAPKISISSLNPLCEKEAIQLLTDSIPNTQYAWTGPKGFTSSEVKPFLKNLNEANNGDYYLKITQNGCVSHSSTILSLSVLIAPKDPKEDKFVAYTGDELMETVVTNDNLIAGKKTLIDIKETTKNGKLKMRNDGAFIYTSDKGYVGLDNFVYTVSYEECPDAVSIPVLAKIEVRVKEAKVPNVLTPNNDGVNDLLIIDYPFNGNEKSELYIYNEWGHEVYRAVPYDNTKAWKSTYKDNPVPDGTYYFLFIPDEGQPGQKGFITVLR